MPHLAFRRPEIPQSDGAVIASRQKGVVDGAHVNGSYTGVRSTNMYHKAKKEDLPIGVSSEIGQIFVIVH